MMKHEKGYFEVDGKRWPITEWAMGGRCSTEGGAFREVLTGRAILAGHEEAIVGHYPNRPISPDRLVGHDPVWAVMKTKLGKRHTILADIVAADGPVVAFEFTE